MIKYNLTCKCNCTFDSWFASSEEFWRLIKKKLITCIECNSNNVNKSIMAPNVSNSEKIDNMDYKFQKNIKKKIIKYQKFIKTVNMLVITLLKKLEVFIMVKRKQKMMKRKQKMMKRKQKVFMVG